MYHFNQLGSLFMQRQTDDTGGPLPASATAGIKSVTAALFESHSTFPTQIWNRYSLASNPFRSGSEATMGWTLRTFDTEGRVTTVKSYRGSAKPTPSTAETVAAGFTGKVQYSYSGDTTTVTDPAAATRTTVVDSLGRLLSVSDADVPTTPEQKRKLSKLDAKSMTATTLAGDPIDSILTHAPANNAPIGGVKVNTKNGWFAARPSGTENIYKIYAESFQGPEHLAAIVAQAQEIVTAAIS